MVGGFFFSPMKTIKTHYNPSVLFTCPNIPLKLDKIITNATDSLIEEGQW